MITNGRIKAQGEDTVSKVEAHCFVGSWVSVFGGRKHQGMAGRALESEVLCVGDVFHERSYSL